MNLGLGQGLNRLPGGAVGTPPVAPPEEFTADSITITADDATHTADE